MSSARTSATRASPPSTTPSSRWSSSTRPTPTTSTWPPRMEAMVAAVAAAVGYEGPLDFSPPWRRVGFVEAVREAAASTCAPTATPPRSSRRSPSAACDAHRGAHLAGARRRPALQVRGAHPGAAHVRARLPDRALPVRARPPLRGGPRRALGGVRRRHGDRQRLLRAHRPRRAARPLRGPDAGSRWRATRRPSPTTSCSWRRSSTACLPRAAWAWGSTGSSCCSPDAPRSARSSVPGDARLSPPRLFRPAHVGPADPACDLWLSGRHMCRPADGACTVRDRAACGASSWKDPDVRRSPGSRRAGW